MNKLYSYKQLESLYGESDKQVKAIYDYIMNIGDCPTNWELEAFKRKNIDCKCEDKNTNYHILNCEK